MTAVQVEPPDLVPQVVGRIGARYASGWPWMLLYQSLDQFFGDCRRPTGTSRDSATPDNRSTETVPTYPEPWVGGFVNRRLWVRVPPWAP